MAQEGAFARVALDQVDVKPALLSRDGEDEPGKARAGAEIEPGAGLRREVEELERVGDVPGPDVLQRRGADQVLDRLPAPELAD